MILNGGAGRFLFQQIFLVQKEDDVFVGNLIDDNPEEPHGFHETILIGRFFQLLVVIGQGDEEDDGDAFVEHFRPDLTIFALSADIRQSKCQLIEFDVLRESKEGSKKWNVSASRRF